MQMVSLGLFCLPCVCTMGLAAEVLVLLAVVWGSLCLSEQLPLTAPSCLPDLNFGRAACNAELLTGLCTLLPHIMLFSFIHSIAGC